MPILIVDDEDYVREALVEALVADGHLVIAAQNGHEALARLKSDPSITMMISDIKMPGISGIELVDMARALKPDLKILLVSGHFIPTDLRVPFLRKPFSLDDLAAAVRSQLG